jgi:hypothetical protein
MASLYQDLLNIRIKAGLTKNDIYERTRIPLDVISEIEKGTISSNKQYQLTYLRSYVRSYAKSLGVKEHDIIAGLDAEASGKYTGLIAKIYLGETISDQNAELSINEEEASSKQSVPATDTTSLRATKEAPTTLNEIDKTGYSRPDPSKTHNLKTPAPPEIEAVDWADMGRKLGNMRSFPYRSVIVIFGLLLFGALGYYFWNNLPFDGSETDSPEVAEQVVNDQPITPSAPAAQTTGTTQSQPVPPPSDTARNIVEAQETVPVSPPAREPTSTRPTPARTTTTGAMPDTLFVTVHAAQDRLEPVRVTSDVNNTRSPYWIESNEAMRFDFLDEIIIEGQLSRMAIWINGHLFEDFREFSTSNRIIELSRETLAGYPHFFNSEPDLENESIQRPRNIHNRPIF